MTEKFWIGIRRMEIFKLWLASKINLFRCHPFGADHYDQVIYYKDILNSLGNSYLNQKADIQYSIFVDELLELIN